MPTKCLAALCFAMQLFMVKTACAQVEVNRADTIQRRWIRLALPGVMTASLPVLYQLWYKDNATAHFHFFNDNAEWFQMDKLGHAFTVNLVQDRYTNFLEKAGYKRQKAAALACGYTLGYLTLIEVMDGFGKGWGFSAGDMAANAAGSLLFWGQNRVWGKQKVQMKFSWSPSPYRKLRPGLLGENHLAAIIKDYNAQTYWLSIPLEKLPGPWGKLLMLSVGTGAKGMLGARSNEFTENNITYHYEDIPRYRCWYLSADINLRDLRTKKKWANGLLHTFGFIKVPFPALEFSRARGMRLLPWMF